MINALVTGKLVKIGELKTHTTGHVYRNFTIIDNGAFVSCVALGDVAIDMAKLAKYDAITAKGVLTLSAYVDKYNIERQGLNLKVCGVLVL
jgi:hypothetical protein